MVEVFKTNVTDSTDAGMIADAIGETLDGYNANFDLHDCDNILRVQSRSGYVDPGQVIRLVEYLGFEAEVLPDEVPTVTNSIMHSREIA
jgi:hypothetical protein